MTFYLLLGRASFTPKASSSTATRRRSPSWDIRRHTAGPTSWNLARRSRNQKMATESPRHRDNASETIWREHTNSGNSGRAKNEIVGLSRFGSPETTARHVCRIGAGLFLSRCDCISYNLAHPDIGSPYLSPTNDKYHEKIHAINANLWR